MRYVQDDIGTVVSQLREEVDGPPYYMYGHRKEINNRLKAKLDDKIYKYQRYPLIALVFDFPEELGSGLIQYPDLNIIIVDFTEPTYNTDERFVKVIKPVLVPIYEQFIKQLKKSGLFMWPGAQAEPKHIRIFRPFWGTGTLEGNDKYIFDDPLDAIEIQKLKINSTNKC